MKKLLSLLTILIISMTSLFAATTDPLCFTSENVRVQVCFQIDGTLEYVPRLEYSTDGTTWQSYDLVNKQLIDLALVGDKVYFRAEDKNETFSLSLMNHIRFKVSGGKVAASGNIMSLLDKECKQTSVPANAFEHLFYVCWGLTQAPELPATTLGASCYSGMFLQCENLSSAPKLPATKMAEYCYDSMFKNCIGLKTPPALPATTLAHDCYYDMFWGCENMTTPPELPATQLSTNCYAGMFGSCKNLTVAPKLPATKLAHACYRLMFSGCKKLEKVTASFTDWTDSEKCTEGWLKDVSSNGTFICPQNLDVTQSDDSHIPEGWTIARTMTKPSDCLCFTSRKYSCEVAFYQEGSDWTTTPSLVYSTDGNVWYDYTFGETISIPNSKVYFMAKDKNETFSQNSSNYITFSSTNTVNASGSVMSLLDNKCQQKSVPQYAFYSLFGDCTYLVTAPKVPATTLADGCYQKMFYGCENLTTVPSLPAKTMANNCYKYMFSGCTNIMNAPELPATTLASYCYQNMFYGCTNLTSAPELPATKLVEGCYVYMFYGCKNLSSVSVGFTDWNSDKISTKSWLYGVADSGTFTCSSSLPEKSGASYIPTGWTLKKTSETIVDLVKLIDNLKKGGTSSTINDVNTLKNKILKK